MFVKRKVHLIACGGTALTLLSIKSSTKDIDFVVPDEKEYEYLTRTIQQLGYAPVTAAGWGRAGESFVFDLFPGKRIHTTELLESPLEKENHMFFKEYSHLYIGILNYDDLLASKLFRGASVDFEDCLALVKAKHQEINLASFEKKYRELARYDIAESRVMGHLEHFLKMLKKEGLG
jgi:hypothetical protein